MKSSYSSPAPPLDSILTGTADNWNFLPCCLELVGSWVVPVDVDRACLRGDEAGSVVVAVFANLTPSCVRTFIHLKFVAAIHVKGDDADLNSVSIIRPDHPLTLVVVEGIKSSRVSVHVAAATVVCRSVAVVHALQLLDIPCRELGVSGLCNARVLGRDRVLVVVDGEGLEAVVHHRGEVVSLSASVHPPSRVAALHVLSVSTSSRTLCRKACFRIGCPGISQVLRSAAATNVRPVDNDIVISIRPTLLVLDSEGVEQLVDGDLEGDTPVLLEANFVPPPPGSVRDDGVATAVA